MTEVWLTEAVSVGAQREEWLTRVDARVARRVDDLCLSALAAAEALFERARLLQQVCSSANAAIFA